MTEESSPDGHCARCDRRLSIRQVVVDWVRVIVLVITMVRSFWS
ncbi:hypothetical protein [Streptomyces sp. NPDC006875]